MREIYLTEEFIQDLLRLLERLHAPDDRREEMRKDVIVALRLLLEDVEIMTEATECKGGVNEKPQSHPPKEPPKGQG